MLLCINDAPSTGPTASKAITDMYVEHEIIQQFLNLNHPVHVTTSDTFPSKCTAQQYVGYIYCRDRLNKIQVKIAYQWNTDKNPVNDNQIKIRNFSKLSKQKYDAQYALTLSVLDKTFTFNLTCMIKDETHGPQDPYLYPISKASLFGIIFLVSCVGLTVILCVGWFFIVYYRQYKRNQMKSRLQKALANSIQQILDKTPIIIHKLNNQTKDSSNDDPVCAICLESFIDNDKLRKLICSHCFHMGCIDPWLLSNHNCPLCNRNILNDHVPSISAIVTSTCPQLYGSQARSTNTVNVNQNNSVMETSMSNL